MFEEELWSLLKSVDEHEIIDDLRSNKGIYREMRRLIKKKNAIHIISKDIYRKWLRHIWKMEYIPDAHEFAAILCHCKQTPYILVYKFPIINKYDRRIAQMCVNCIHDCIVSHVRNSINIGSLR